MEELRVSVDAIHKTASSTANDRRSRVASRRDQSREVERANLDIGDFVLVAKRSFRSGEKLSLRWRGPCRVVGTLSDYVFEVEDMITGVVMQPACVSTRMHLWMFRPSYLHISLMRTKATM